MHLADYSWDDKSSLVGVAERNGRTVQLVPTDGGKPTVVNGTWFSPSTARISPYGKWLAFASGQSGPFQVYVSPVPPTGSSGRYRASREHPRAARRRP